MTTNNHPANGPVSLERLHQISEILSKASAQSDGGNLGYAMADAVKVIDGAIEAFGAEPVAIAPVMYKGIELLKKDGLELIRDGIAEATELESMCMAKALLSAQPAPVVPEWTNEQCLEFLSIAFRHAEIKGDLELDDIRLGMKMVNESRSAMLQGTDGKPELTVWYGSMPETNGKTNWTAMLHRKGQHPWEGITIDLSEYPDRVRYEADRMRHLIGELADEPDILAYDADAHSGYVKPGNSPVTPDGLVMMPKKLTAENGAKSVLSGEFSETKFINCPDCFGDDDCETCDGSGRIEITVPVTWTTIKAIWAKGVEHFAAAPQQEVKNG